MSLDLALSWEGHRVRMVGTPDAPEWIAADVCALLELRASNPWKHVPPQERGKHTALTLGGWQKVITLREAGVYRLITVSRIPAAERFRSWLFGEVLPSIRKHGCYPPPAGRALQDKVNLDDPGSLRGLLEALTARRLADAQVIAELAPKAEVYDDCMSSADLLTVAQVANILARPGRPLGEVRLFRFLREERLLQGDNRPYQEQIEAGRFVVRETPWTKGDGVQRLHVQPLITQRGAEYIRRRIDAASGQGSLLPARSVPEVVPDLRRPS
jgi:anti-repressor protein